jgi:hypothetical protein
MYGSWSLQEIYRNLLDLFPSSGKERETPTVGFMKKGYQVLFLRDRTEYVPFFSRLKTETDPDSETLWFIVVYNSAR